MAIFFMFATYIAFMSFIFASAVCDYQKSKSSNIIRLTWLISTLLFGSVMLLAVLQKYLHLLLE